MHEPHVLQEPELRPFLPLLYVAWADGDLSDAERALLCDRLTERPGLKPRLRDSLKAWLTTDEAPDPETLAALHETLVQAAGTLGPEARGGWRSLAEAMARANGSSPETLEALDSVRDVLSADRGVLAIRAEFPPDTTFQQPPRFDVQKLAALLNGHHAEAREKARAFLADPDHRAVYGVDKETYRALTFARLEEVAALGMGRLTPPGEEGGERDLGPFLATFETLAFGDLSLVVLMGVQFGLWGGSVAALGSEAQKREWLPRIASLEAPGCFAMSEVGHGSNVADLETIARYDHDTRELVIHTPSESARKDWAGGAALHARYGTVFAQLEVAGARHGVHAIIVPLRDGKGETLPGVRIGDVGTKQGLNGVDNGRIWFEEVRVPVGNLLSRYASITEDGRYESPIESPGRRFFTMLGTLVAGRLSVASASVSAAKVGLSIALRYATHRRQFGPTSEPETLLLHYPTHQRRLLPRLAATYGYHFACEAAAEAFLAQKEGEDTRMLEGHIAAIKAGATWSAMAALRAAREACGGMGYLSVNRIPDLLNDADVFTTFEGDNTVLSQLVARSLLTNYRQQFARGGPGAWLRFFARQARTTVAANNPFARRPSDPDTLRSADFQMQALRFREEHLLTTAAFRVQKRIRAGTEAQQATLEVQEHLVALAGAHTDRRVLEAFTEAEARIDGAEREVLGRLRALHGLCTLEAQLAWFLEDGHLDAGQARALRREIPVLFQELLPDVLPLLDAFGIPDVCLAAPIAFDDPAHPRW